MTGPHDEEGVEYLDLEDLLGLTRSLRAGPVRDRGLLDSCCARERSTAYGADAYRTLEQKAAALLPSPAHNYALVDGHKRLAWLATVVSLDINGGTAEIDDDGEFGLVTAVAEGSLDIAAIAARLATD